MSRQSQQPPTVFRTSADWVSLNPVLLTDQTGVEEDTGRFKVGDGATRWVSLAYEYPATTTSQSAPPPPGSSGIIDGGTP